MRVYRICARRFAALDGEGARLYGGRWNRPGTPVVYSSATRALAILELLVHVDDDLAPTNLVMMAIEIPENLRVRRLAPRRLPRACRQIPGP